MNHYEVLGVTRTASADDLRRAYLSLARRHHPDNAGGDAEAMVSVNASWAVLSDPAEREAYDRTLRREDRSFVAPPNDQHFVPYDDGDDDDDDWRYQDDVGDPRTTPKRGVLMAPVVCSGALLACFIGWAITGHPILIAGMVVFGALAVVGFLIAPIVAMAKASQFEQHR